MKSVGPRADLAAEGPRPGELKAEFRFDPRLPVFQGHFPGKPLVPGVMQIEMVRCAAEALRGVRLDILRVTGAKFSGEIAPGERILVLGTATPEAEGERVKATLRVNGVVRATISLILK